MEMTNVINLTTNEKMRNYAKVYSTLINNEFQRKRAYASLMALYSLCTYIEDNNLADVQKSMTVFRTPKLNEKFEITDFYINNWHIDVRIAVDNKEFIVPKRHYEYDILPDFYAVVKVDKELSNLELLGFIDASNVAKSEFDKDYYKIDCELLIGYNEFTEKVKDEKPINFDENEHEFFKESYLSLIDDDADIETAKKVLKHIFACPECRAEFCCFCGFEMVSKNVQDYPDIFDDDMLNIVGAQAVEDEKYEGKEETIYIGEGEPPKIETQPTDVTAENEPVEEIKSDDNVTENKSGDDTVTNDTPTVTKPEEKSDTDKQPVVDDNIQEYADDGDDTKNKEEAVSEILDELFNIEDEQETPTTEASGPETPNSVETDATKDVAVEEQKVEETTDADVAGENVDEKEKELPDDIIGDEVNEHKQETSAPSEQGVEEIEDYSEEQDEEKAYLYEYTGNFDDNTTETSYISNIKEDDEVDKVIVDYDEVGEPVYSYINKVENLNDEADIISDDDDKQDENIKEENSVEEYNNADDELAQYDVEDSLPDNILADSDDEITEEKDETNTEEEYETYKADSDDNNGDEETIQEFDEEAEENDEDSNHTDEEENDDEDDEDDEYIEDDEENDEITPNANKSVKKGCMIVIAIIAILSIIGTFVATKVIKGAHPTPQNPPQEGVDIPDQTQTNDLFDSANNAPTQNDLIAPEGNEQPQPAENNNEQQQPAENNNGNEQPQPVEQPQPAEQPQPTANNDNETAKPVENQGDLNHVIANALNEGGAKHVSVTGVNWQCAPELFANQAFKQYLHQSDKVLKMNLNKNILDATEQISSNSVKTRLEIDNEGNLVTMNIENSSGSQQIDNIVLQSIKETIETQKSQIPNDSAQHKGNYVLKVVIKL